MNPPRHAVAFLRWFCREDCVEEIEGDLTEIFLKESEVAPRRAKVMFAFSVLKYFRPAFMKSFRGHYQTNSIDMLRSYFKTGWRTLSKYKGYSFINIGGLTLGFSSCLLIYLFVIHHLQYDNFHSDPDRIYRFVTEEHMDVVDYTPSVPPGFANAFKTDYPYAEKVARIATQSNLVIAVTPGKKTKEMVAFAENDFFGIFNFPLVSGATPVLDQANTAVITARMAAKLFGNETPLGKTFQVDGKEFVTVVGVLRDLPLATFVKSEIFVSYPTLKHYQQFLSSENWGGTSDELQVYGRLYPDQDIHKIEQEIGQYVKKFRARSKNVHHYKLQPLADIHFDPRYDGINPNLLWIFSFIGVFLIVVASINFVNISTAQSAVRSREIGVRKVLGSRKGSLFWQFMIEALVVTVLAFLMAVVITVTVVPYFNSLFELQLSINEFLTSTFLLFTLLILAGVVLMAGSYPGILLARIAPLMALKGRLSPKDSGGLLTRRVLVIVQFAISIALIIGTIGVNKQINYATRSDLGYNRSEIVMIPLPDRVEPGRLRTMKDQIAKIAGVESVSTCFGAPGAANNQWGTNLRFDNRAENEEFQIQAKIADAQYLETFDLKLIAGRNFTERDSVDEILVNAAFARKAGVSAPEELLGRPLDISNGYIRATIVGVVGDFHDGDFHQEIRPIFIAPDPRDYYDVAVRINMEDAATVLSAIEKEWSAVYPAYIFDYGFLDDRVAKLYKTDQLFLSLAKLFSGIAILIGCLGLYGLILFLVIQRTKEIGIRKVLGGSVGHILLLVSRDFFRLLLIGSLIASPIAWYFLRQWLDSYTYKTDISWWIFVMATGMVAVITLFTISYQALQAALANPVKSLRSE